MNKRGYIFDLLKLENGWVLTLFSFFRIGWLSGNEGYGPFKCLQFGIGKLESTISLAWKDSLTITIDEVKGYS